jgi:hypothetical protein
MPEKFHAGTTVEFTLTLSAYNPTNATLAVVLKGPGVATATVTPNSIQPSGSSWLVSFSDSDTAALPPGLYRWFAQATYGGKKYEADCGDVEVLRNLMTAAAGDAQTQEEKWLAMIDEWLSGNLTAPIKSYAIGARQLEYMDPSEIVKIRGQLARAVRR